MPTKQDIKNVKLQLAFANAISKRKAKLNKTILLPSY